MAPSLLSLVLQVILSEKGAKAFSPQFLEMQAEAVANDRGLAFSALKWTFTQPPRKVGALPVYPSADEKAANKVYQTCLKRFWASCVVTAMAELWQKAQADERQVRKPPRRARVLSRQFLLLLSP